MKLRSWSDRFYKTAPMNSKAPETSTLQQPKIVGSAQHHGFHPAFLTIDILAHQRQPKTGSKFSKLSFSYSIFFPFRFRNFGQQRNPKTAAGSSLWMFWKPCFPLGFEASYLQSTGWSWHPGVVAAQREGNSPWHPTKTWGVSWFVIFFFNDFGVKWQVELSRNDVFVWGMKSEIWKASH